MFAAAPEPYTPSALAVCLMLVVTVLGITLYFVPGIVAALSGHPHTAGILLLNLFLGWTLLGWVGALVWAAVQPEPAPSVRPAPQRPARPRWQQHQNRL